MVVLMVGCNGCWDKNELKNLALISGMGVDRTSDGKYITTFQVIIPSMVKEGGSGSKGPGGGGGSGGGMTQAVLVTSGESMTGFGSARVNRFWISRNLYLPTSQVIVFGQDAARQGIRSAYDLYARYPQKRLTEMVVVAKGTASEILKAQNQIDKIPAIALITLMNDSYNWTGQVIATRSIDLFEYRVSKTRAAVMPQVEVITAPVGEKVIKMSGTAVIRKDRLVGELNENETRGLLWVLGKVKLALLEIGDKSGKGMASLEVTQARSLNADIYGFGEAVKRKHPREWKTMKSKWDKIFPQIKLAIKVETTVFSSGELLKPPLPQ